MKLKMTCKSESGRIYDWEDRIPKDKFATTSGESEEFFAHMFFTMVASPVDPGELPPLLE